MLLTSARETPDLVFLLKYWPGSCCQFHFRERLLPPAYTHTDATLPHTQNNHWPAVPQNTISAIWSEQAGDGGHFDVSLIPSSLLQLLLALFRGGYRTGLPRPHYPTNTTQNTHTQFLYSRGTWGWGLGFGKTSVPGISSWADQQLSRKGPWLKPGQNFSPNRESWGRNVFRHFFSKKRKRRLTDFSAYCPFWPGASDHALQYSCCSLTHEPISPFELQTITFPWDGNSVQCDWK